MVSSLHMNHYDYPRLVVNCKSRKCIAVRLRNYLPSPILSFSISILLGTLLGAILGIRTNVQFYLHWWIELVLDITYHFNSLGNFLGICLGEVLNLQRLYIIITWLIYQNYFIFIQQYNWAHVSRFYFFFLGVVVVWEEMNGGTILNSLHEVRKNYQWRKVIYWLAKKMLDCESKLNGPWIDQDVSLLN